MKRGGYRALQALALLAGFVFLYAPIALLAIYSFNASRLVTVWGGFSTRWYEALWRDDQLIESAFISLRVAAVAAAIATALGGCAAVALTRYGRFRGRLALSLVVFAPLALPEVVIGLALLLLFVALGVGRGYWAIVAGHATMGLCYVAVIVQARLATLDRALEEAASDLGAGPLTTLATVTLPLAAPALVAGYLLAFTLSLDDVVIASFTSGPGSSTLPMRIYSAVRLGVAPEINAVSTLLLGAVAVALAVAGLASRRSRDP